MTYPRDFEELTMLAIGYGIFIFQGNDLFKDTSVRSIL